MRMIVETKTIWVSNSRFLNDFEEVTRAIKTIERSPDLIVQGLETHERIEIIRSQLQRLMNSDFHVFVSSFCKHPDKLSQCRGYARDGACVSICFSRKVLEEMGYQVSEVIYGSHFIETAATRLKDVCDVSEDLSQTDFRR